MRKEHDDDDAIMVCRSYAGQQEVVELGACGALIVLMGKVHGDQE